MCDSAPWSAAVRCGGGEDEGFRGGGVAPITHRLGISDRYFFSSFFSFLSRTNQIGNIVFFSHMVVENHSHRNDRRHRPS